MKISILYQFLSSLIILSTLACNSNDATIPRRQAYPRIAECDTLYNKIQDLPVIFEINSKAITKIEKKEEGSIWINIHYPKYKTTIYCTLTPVEETTIENSIDNRIERIYLNLGGLEPEIEEAISIDGYYGDIIKAYSIKTTPIQFISTKHHNPKWLLSGSVFFENADNIHSLDSVAPIVNIMYRDTKKLLESLQDD